MDAESELALWMSGGALAVSAIGTVLSYRFSKASQRLAIEARDDARAARTDALWSSYLESVHEAMAWDPAQPVGDAWKRLRVTATALVDGLPAWDGLDRWLVAEHTLGATLSRQVLENVQPGDTADERLEHMKPTIDWGVALLNNARLFRAQGHDQAVMNSLTDHAWTVVRNVHERNGWDLPDSPSTQPL